MNGLKENLKNRSCSNGKRCQMDDRNWNVVAIGGRGKREINEICLRLTKCFTKKKARNQ